MLVLITILSSLVLVNVLLLKFSCNEPKRPEQSTPLNKTIKIVRLEPKFSENQIGNTEDKKLKVSSK